MTGKWRAPLRLGLSLIGLLSLLVYGRAYALGDLREQSAAFVITFFILFALYLAAVALVLRHEAELVSPATWFVIILFALAPRLLLLPMTPTLSDDMFRYVWDGRIQNNSLSPYQSPPDAPEVRQFRQGDTAVWPHINRKSSITIYPPGAQLAFATTWRVVGDSVTGFKAAFVLAELGGAWLLVFLLRALDQPPQRILVYLWSPLLIFEIAHAGHVDGLMLPLLIFALWARVKERYWLLGLALGLAVVVKLTPLILLPALLPPMKTRSGERRMRDESQHATLPATSTGKARPFLRPVLKTLAGLVGVVILAYLPYLLRSGNAVGFLPDYFGENFNMGLARVVFAVADRYGRSGSVFANLITFGGLVGLSLLFVFKPAPDAKATLIRCVWLIGWFTLFTQNLFPWYLLWLLPLLACLVEPGRVFGFKLAPMTGWLYFSGLIVFSYLFFIDWRIVPWAQTAEFAPLYALLLAGWWFSRNSRGVEIAAGARAYQVANTFNRPP